MKGVSEALKSSVVALLVTSDGDMPLLCSLISRGMVGFRSSRGQRAAFNYQRQLFPGKGSREVDVVRDLGLLLIEYVVPKNEIDRQPTKMLLDTCNRKNHIWWPKT